MLPDRPWNVVRWYDQDGDGSVGTFAIYPLAGEAEVVGAARDVRPAFGDGAVSGTRRTTEEART